MLDVTPIAATDAIESLRSLPGFGKALVALGAAGGLALWGLGHRLARPLLALAVAPVGGIAGYLGASMTGLGSIGGVPASLIGAVTGFAAGLAVGLWLFRLTMVLAGAASLSLAAAAAASIYVAVAPRPPAPAGDPAAESPDAGVLGLPGVPWTTDAIASTLGLDEPPADAEPAADGDIEPQPAPAAPPSADERIRRFVRALGDELRPTWRALPESSRRLIGLAAAAGAALGALAGLVAPRKSAMVVTALAGAAVALPCLVSLARLADAPGLALLPGRPLGWMLVWAAFAAVGLLIQAWSMMQRRRAG